VIDRVLVVIPVWNEAANLHGVVGELRGTRPDDELLVVDDGSTDGSGEMARRLGCRVVTLPFRLGYGAAVQAGVRYGLRREYAVTVTFDGDGQHDPADVAPLLEAVREGADVALGSRFLAPEAYHGGLLRRGGRRLFSLLLRLLTGLRLTDPTSGL
jgi:glycosyltransferase involved in cell wall biosynthesis